MIISKFNVRVANFTVVPDWLSKEYSIGLLFAVDVIETKINQISNMFYSTFLNYFLLPFCVTIGLFVFFEIW